MALMINEVAELDDLLFRKLHASRILDSSNALGFGDTAETLRVNMPAMHNYLEEKELRLLAQLHSPLNPLNQLIVSTKDVEVREADGGMKYLTVILAGGEFSSTLAPAIKLTKQFIVLSKRGNNWIVDL